MPPDRRTPSEPQDIPSAFLRAKHAWERGDADEALRQLTALIGEPGLAQTLHVPAAVLETFAPAPFESLVARILSTGDTPTILFTASVQRLWAQMPAQFVLRTLELREGLTGDVGGGALRIIYEAAANGMLSRDLLDYDRVAKVVLREADQPLVCQLVDWRRLDRLLSYALERQSWNAFVSARPPLIANLLLYRVFHRARAVSREMVLDALTRLAEDQPTVLDIGAQGILHSIDDPAISEQIVRIGFRSQAGSASCLVRVAEALCSRDFHALPEECMPTD